MMKRVIWAIAILLLLLVAGGIYYVATSSFVINKTVEDSFYVESPVTVVGINLLAADAQKVISDRLGVRVISTETVKNPDIDLGTAFFGTLEFVKEEISVCEIDNPDLGTLRMKLRITTQATPDGKITTTSELAEPCEKLQGFSHIVILSLDPEFVSKSGRTLTKVSISYSTTIRVDYPDLPAIRKIAQGKTESANTKSVKIIKDTLKELVSKQLPNSVWEPHEVVKVMVSGSGEQNPHLKKAKSSKSQVSEEVAPTSDMDLEVDDSAFDDME